MSAIIATVFTFLVLGAIGAAFYLLASQMVPTTGRADILFDGQTHTEPVRITTISPNSTAHIPTAYLVTFELRQMPGKFDLRLNGDEFALLSEMEGDLTWRDGRMLDFVPASKLAITDGSERSYQGLTWSLDGTARSADDSTLYDEFEADKFEDDKGE